MSRTYPLLPKHHLKELAADIYEKIKISTLAVSGNGMDEETDASYVSDQWEDLELRKSFCELTLENFLSDEQHASDEIDSILVQDKGDNLMTFQDNPVLEVDPSHQDERVLQVESINQNSAPTQKEFSLTDPPTKKEREKTNVCATNDICYIKDESRKRKRSLSGQFLKKVELEEESILEVSLTQQDELIYGTELTIQMSTLIEKGSNLTDHLPRNELSEKVNTCFANDIYKIKDRSLKRKRSLSGRSLEKPNLAVSILEADPNQQEELFIEVELIPDLGSTVDVETTAGTVGNTPPQTESSSSEAEPGVFNVRDRSLKKRHSYASESDVVVKKDPNEIPRAFSTDLGVKFCKSIPFRKLVRKLREKILSEELREKENKVFSKLKDLSSLDNSKILFLDLSNNEASDEKLGEKDLEEEIGMDEYIDVGEDIYVAEFDLDNDDDLEELDYEVHFEEDERFEEEEDLEDEVNEVHFEEKEDVDEGKAVQEKEHLEQKGDLEKKEESQEEKVVKEVIPSCEITITVIDASVEDSSPKKLCLFPRNKSYMPKSEKYRLYSRRERILRKRFRKKHLRVKNRKRERTFRNKNKRGRKFKSKRGRKFRNKMKRERQLRIIKAKFSHEENPWNKKIMLWLSRLISEQSSLVHEPEDQSSREMEDLNTT